MTTNHTLCGSCARGCGLLSCPIDMNPEASETGCDLFYSFWEYVESLR